MKTRCFLTTFALAALFGACQVEDEMEFYDQPYVNAEIRFLYKPVDYKCEVIFEGNTYRLAETSGQNSIAVPLASLDADTTRRAPLIVQPLNREERPEGEPSVLMTTLKADTVLQILKPVNDTVQFYDAEKHFTVPLSCKFIPLGYGGNYNNHGITINGDKLPEFVNNGIYFTRGNEKDKTIAFYERDPEKAAVSQYDPETQEPLSIIEHYDFEEGKALEYIHPLGGVPVLYTGEDQFPKAKFEMQYRQGDTEYFFFWNGEPVSRYSDFYVTNEEWLNGEVVVNRSVSKGDTVEVYRENLSLQNGEVFSLNDFGDATLSGNEYTGEDPDNQECAFIRYTLPAEYVTGSHYDEELGEWVDEKYTGNYDIKVVVATLDRNWEMTIRETIHEIKDMAGGTWCEPFQLRLRGDIIPEDLYDKYANTGEPFFMYDADWNFVDEYYRIKGYLIFEVYQAGTDIRCYSDNYSQIDVFNGGLSMDLIPYNEEWTGFYLPSNGFDHKCYMIEQYKDHMNVVISQGQW